MVAKEGLPYIAVFFVLAVFLFFFHLWIPFVFTFLFVCSFVFFFRDPNRRIPQEKNLILAPADGRIVEIQQGIVHSDFSSPVHVVRIFLSIFDVHITRAPLAGVVRRIEYKQGKFFPAYKHEASLKNESSSIFIDNERMKILVRQIVGIAARRIKTFVCEKDRVRQGQKIGLMYFGSRVELYLPNGVELMIQKGQKVKAGLTRIAGIKE